MKMPYQLRRTSLWKTRLLFPPLFHIAADSIGYFIAPSLYRLFFSGHSFWFQFLPEFLLGTFGMYIISESNFWLYYYLNKRIPWENHCGKRLVFQLICALLFSVVASISIKCSSLIFHDHSDPAIMENLVLLTVAVTFLLSSIYFGIFIFHRMRSSFIETEELKRENLIAQNQALRQQIDPHFLFNSITTLTTLIEENKVLAIEFVQRLSKVYRHVLQSKEYDLIDLKKEIEFVRDYAFAFEMRFGEHFRLNIDVPDTFLTSKIPPLTLQILVENAVKHNIISREHPLQITIGMEGDSKVVVRNPLQRKPVLESPTHIGLDNILTRYKYVAQGIVEVIENKTEFIVKLPLVKP